MMTSDDPSVLAADLTKMTLQPVSVERAEELLAEEMAWLPEGEPQQCIAEDCTLDLDQVASERGKLRRRTVLSRRKGDQLRIVVEVSILRSDGIEIERKRFEEPSGEADRYVEALRQDLRVVPRPL